jgi:hypothetical protein
MVSSIVHREFESGIINLNVLNPNLISTCAIFIAIPSAIVYLHEDVESRDETTVT